jgi:hypothetical protein
MLQENTVAFYGHYIFLSPQADFRGTAAVWLIMANGIFRDPFPGNQPFPIGHMVEVVLAVVVGDCRLSLNVQGKERTLEKIQ